MPLASCRVHTQLLTAAQVSSGSWQTLNSSLPLQNHRTQTQCWWPWLVTQQLIPYWIVNIGIVLSNSQQLFHPPGTEKGLRQYSQRHCRATSDYSKGGCAAQGHISPAVTTQYSNFQLHPHHGTCDFFQTPTNCLSGWESPNFRFSVDLPSSFLGLQGGRWTQVHPPPPRHDVRQPTVLPRLFCFC